MCHHECHGMIYYGMSRPKRRIAAEIWLEKRNREGGNRCTGQVRSRRHPLHFDDEHGLTPAEAPPGGRWARAQVPAQQQQQRQPLPSSKTSKLPRRRLVLLVLLVLLVIFLLSFLVRSGHGPCPCLYQMRNLQQLHCVRSDVLGVW